MSYRLAIRALIFLLVCTLTVSLAAPVFAQGRGNDNRPGSSGGGNGGGNSGGGNPGSSGNDNRGGSGNSQTVSATPTRTTTTANTTTTTTTAPTGTTATTTDDGKGRGKDEKDDNHGNAVRDAVRDAKDNAMGGIGALVSEAARSALGKPEQAVVSVSGLLTSLTETAGTIEGTAGASAIILTDGTRIKTADDSDAALADLQALVPVKVRARGRIGADGALVAMRIEVRASQGEGEGEDAETTLEGVIDALSATGFTLVTRAGTAPTGTTSTTTAPTGSTATTTTAPTGTTATTTTAPTGTTATSTAPTTYTVLVGAETKIVRNDVTATLADLRSGDEVEARGALAGSTLTATRVLADGPIGAPVSGTAPTGTTATTTP